MVANVSGVASFILAVAGNNVEKLSLYQKYGLAIASAVMIWCFMAGVLIRQAKHHVVGTRGIGAAVGTLFFGAWIGAGLLMAALPLFGFGLNQAQTDQISLIGAAAFAAVFSVGALILPQTFVRSYYSDHP
jgi:LytS/YehU family sensor histidine kinase